MADLIMHPQVNHRWAIEHMSEVGFYSVIGIGVVTVLILLGLYMLAENALQMVAVIFHG
jgi:hypothetical protein